MRTLLVLSIIFIPGWLFGQQVDFSILNNYSNTEDPQMIMWHCCNDDSAFFKVDTLMFATGFYDCGTLFNFTAKGKIVSNMYWQANSGDDRVSATFISTIKKGRIKKKKLT